MKLIFVENKNLADYRGKVHKNVYICECKFSEKDSVKSCGFWWNRDNKLWWTPYRDNAIKLAEFAEGELRNELLPELREKEENLESSRAVDADIDVPAPDGLSYLPFQKAGIAFGLKRDSFLIGDEMGLGKTIQVIGIINGDDTIKKVLVICPATPKINWKRELDKWLTRSFDVSVQNSSDVWDYLADINIINFDILKKFHNEIHETEWDFVIVDESTYIKSPKTQRSQEIVGKYYNWKKMTRIEIEDVLEKFRVEKENEWGQQLGHLNPRKKACLTGTPIPSKPIELWPILHWLDPITYKNFMGFAKRYCMEGHNGYGYDFSGARNLSELQEKLRTTIMIRRLKKQVLKELPPKFRQVVEIPLNGNSKIIAQEREYQAQHEARLIDLKVAIELAKISDDPNEFKMAVKALKQYNIVHFADMSRVRHETALAKVDYVVSHLEDAISNHKVVCFAYHRDVIEKIAAAFGDKAVILYGGMSEKVKNEAIDKFQTDDSVKLFVGQIEAAGKAITLHAASHVVFAELDWVPGNMTQCEDRCHRIDEKNIVDGKFVADDKDNVLVQHLVLEGSMDVQMAHKLIAKQEVIEKALDEDIEIQKVKYFITPGDDATTKDAPKSRIEKMAEKMTDTQRETVHEALARLSMMCDGARKEDNMGFNKIDTRIGKSLAENFKLTPKQAAFGKLIVMKYKRQLPSYMIDIIKGE